MVVGGGGGSSGPLFICLPVPLHTRRMALPRTGRQESVSNNTRLCMRHTSRIKEWRRHYITKPTANLWRVVGVVGVGSEQRVAWAWRVDGGRRVAGGGWWPLIDCGGLPAHSLTKPDMNIDALD